MTDPEYLALRYFMDYYESERERLFPKTNYFSREMLSKLPQPAPTNNERSAIEVYEFIHDPPNKYFLYVQPKPKGKDCHYGIVTTWMGDKLGHITWLSTEWRSNFGDKRKTISFTGINGLRYEGIYYCSAGDYAKVKLMHPKWRADPEAFEKQTKFYFKYHKKKEKDRGPN